MASFPYVKKGDEFKPNVHLENAVRRIVNQHTQKILAQGGSASKGSFGRISVWNTETDVIPAGSAVTFVNWASVNYYGVIPCKLADSNSKFWGIVTDNIEPNSIGSCVVSGTVEVEIIGGGDFAALADNGKIIAADSGFPILFRNENQAVINLGGGSSSGYCGSFAVTVIENKINIASGYAEVNLTSFEFSEHVISAATFPCYVWIEFFVDATSTRITSTFSVGETRPKPKANKSYVVLAYIDNEKNVKQLQYGDVHVALWSECAWDNLQTLQNYD